MTNVGVSLCACAGAEIPEGEANPTARESLCYTELSTAYASTEIEQVEGEHVAGRREREDEDRRVGYQAQPVSRCPADDIELALHKALPL